MALKGRIQALFTAAESSYGSPGTNGFPDISGLTFYAAEFDAGTAKLDGLSPREAELNTVSSEYYEHAREVEKWCDASDEQLYSGSLQVTYDLRMGGSFTAFGSYATIPLFMGLRSGLCSTAAGSASETPVGGSTVNRFTPTTALDYFDGEIIRVTIDGRAEYSLVTKVDTGTPLIHHSPAMTAAIAAQTVHHMDALYAASQGTLGSSLVHVIDGDSWRAVLVGCRAQSMRFYAEGRAMKVDVTYECPLAIVDHDGTALTYPASVTNNAEPTIADGQIAHMSQAYVITSDADTAGITAPAEQGRQQHNTDPWECTITNTLAAVGQTHTAAGVAELEVVDSKIEASINLSNPDSNVSSDYPAVRRTLILGASAGGASDGAGNGFAICIPSAVLRSDPMLYDTSGELVGQRLVYAAGRNDLHDSTTLPAGAPFIIGVGL